MTLVQDAPPAAGPPTPATARPRLAAAAYRVFAPDRPREPVEYGRLGSDFLAGLGFDRAAANRDAGRGNTFVNLLDGLLAGLPGPAGAALGDLDLAVIAHHTPDLDCRESAACYLTHVLPGAPETFAVTDQGVGAPFTALRLLTALANEAGAAGGRGLRGALFVLEQAVQLLPDLSAAETGITDSAVAFLVGESGPMELLETVEAPAADTATVVDRLAWALGRARAAFESREAWYGATSDAQADLPVVLIAGSGLRADEVAAAVAAATQPGGPVSVRQVPERHLCTAVWAALATGRPDPGGLVLADRDRRTGRLHLAVLTVDRGDQESMTTQGTDMNAHGGAG